VLVEKLQTMKSVNIVVTAQRWVDLGKEGMHPTCMHKYANYNGLQKQQIKATEETSCFI